MSLSRILANIGTALDSATTGDFLSKVDSDGVFGGVAYSSVTGTPTVLDSANITNLVDSAYIQLRQTAVASGGLDSAGVTAILDSDYITNITTASGFQMFEYDATAGQTEFTGSDVNGNTLAYSEYGLLVHYNGILLSGATDYTATDGTTVVLTDSADADARITIAKWSLASAGGSSYALGGDRALILGHGGNTTNEIDYFSISTPGNAADFGDMTTTNLNPCATSDGSTGIWMNSGQIDYVTIATIGNASSFGTSSITIQERSAFSDGTYAVWAGGGFARNDTIDYVTIATPSNTSDFGNLSTPASCAGGAADTTRGIIHLSTTNTQNGATNIIEYVTIASPSNSTDFGDLTTSRCFVISVADDTYALAIGGRNASYTYLDVIDYVTIQTTGNATDFGDLTAIGGRGAGGSDGTYGAFHVGSYNGATGSNVIERITIATPGNSSDHGDLLDSKWGTGGCAGSPS